MVDHLYFPTWKVRLHFPTRKATAVGFRRGVVSVSSPASLRIGADPDGPAGGGVVVYEDQNSSSVCWSPWSSRHSRALPFWNRHTWTSGDDQRCSPRSAETTVSATTRSPCPMTSSM